MPYTTSMVPDITITNPEGREQVLLSTDNYTHTMTSTSTILKYHRSLASAMASLSSSDAHDSTEGMPSVPLSELWYERAKFGEEKRLTALKDTAEFMADLSVLHFPHTEVSRYAADGEGNASEPDTRDENGQYLSAHSVNNEQYTSFDEFLTHHKRELNKEARGRKVSSTNDPMAFALNILIDSIPKILRTNIPLSVSLSANFDFQNILVDPTTGKVTNFIGFENSTVRPVHVGAAAYPSWLMRDLSPTYTFTPDMLHADSPQELEYYRRYYADCWADIATRKYALANKSVYDPQWTRKSHVLVTIYNALLSTNKKERDALVDTLLRYAYRETWGLSRHEASRLVFEGGWKGADIWILRLAVSEGLWDRAEKKAVAALKVSALRWKFVGLFSSGKE